MAMLFVCLLPLLTSQIGERPTQPDFSGEWVLVASTAPAADAATVLNVRQPIIDRTVQGTPMAPAYLDLMVERLSSRGVQSERYAIGVVSGTVGGTAASGIENRESANWVGDSLVITSSRWSGSGASRRLESERSEAWQFDSDGRLVITIAEKDGQRETRTRLGYRRR
jgi:hypothetical protein